LHQDILDEIKSYFEKTRHNRKNLVMTSNNEKQAYYPEGSVILPNRNGTHWMYYHIFINGLDKTIILLPGPPWEMEPMLMSMLLNIPKEKYRRIEICISENVRHCESAMETLISDIVTSQTNPTIAPYAKKGEVMLRVTARYDKKADDADIILKPVLDKLYERLENIYLQTVILSLRMLLRIC
jgi:nicotinamide-nucleotide amidase